MLQKYSIIAVAVLVFVSIKSVASHPIQSHEGHHKGEITLKSERTPNSTSTPTRVSSSRRHSLGERDMNTTIKDQGDKDNNNRTRRSGKKIEEDPPKPQKLTNEKNDKDNKTEEVVENENEDWTFIGIFVGGLVSVVIFAFGINYFFCSDN